MNAHFSRVFRSLFSLVASAVLAVLFGVVLVGFLDQARGVAARPHEAGSANVIADLAITTTNNLTQVAPGTQVIYSLTLSNPSNEIITKAAVLDSLSPNYFHQGYSINGVNALVQNVTFTSGQPIGFFATFGPGGFLNVLITGTLSADATGTLTNTAKITAPADVTDPNLNNNTATDADPIVASSNPMADVQISKTDGVTQVKTAQALSYTVMVTNAGPMAVTGVRITDVLPSGYQATNASVAYRSATQRGLGLSSAGLLTATYDLLPGGTVMIVVNGLVKPSATTDLTNTATVTLPATTMDPDGTNNVAVDVNALIVLPRTYLPLIRKQP
jgi:uncharacterized repeat protein (TIGR01451 family)